MNDAAIVSTARLPIGKFGGALKDVSDLDLGTIVKVIVNGGAIALGHSISATGSILLTNLIYEMKRRNGHFALGTMCIAGGQGIAMIVENEES